MKDVLRKMLDQWLISGTDAQKRHAEFRLAQPDVEDISIFEYPSLVEQAKHAVVAAASVVGSIVQRKTVIVSQEEQDRRLVICHACIPPEGFYDAVQGRCMKCGCFSSLKSWIATEQCPIGKW